MNARNLQAEIASLKGRRKSLDCANGVHHPDNCDASTCECSCHEE